MNEINLLDETFDKTQAHNYNLYFQTGSNGFSYCLLDAVRNKYVAFRHYPGDINIEGLISLIHSDPVLELSYKSVNHMLADGKSTLVPEMYFDEKSKDQVFQLNHTHDSSSEILYNSLREAMVVNLFAYPKSYMTKLKEIYPNIRSYHRTSPFIEALALQSAKWNNPKCFVAIHKTGTDIGIAQKKKLEFFNSFSFIEKTDIAYYILNILDQLKLSPKATEVYISIDMENHLEMLEFLRNSLGMLKPLHPSDQYTYSYILEQVKLSRFVNLFNLALCE